jgi:protocatechuate 3,4-dioxygenase beta subunit
VGGATIAITKDGWYVRSIPELVVTTDRDGAWSAPVLPGTYRIGVAASGYLPREDGPIAIAAGTTSRVESALIAGGTEVRGTVTDAGGGPIAGARVVAGLYQSSVVAVAAADGTYQMTLLDGVYDLVGSHEDYVSDSQEVALSGIPVTIDFHLAAGAAIRGVVLAADSGEPVAGATVTVTPERQRRGRELGSGVSDEHGIFTIRGLPTGALAVSATARGYASGTPTVVRTTAGEQHADIQVRVDPAFSIIGRVVEEGHPDNGVRGVGVRAFTGSQLHDTISAATTDEQGRFELTGLLPAAYALQAIDPGSEHADGPIVDVRDRDVGGVSIMYPARVMLTGTVTPPAEASIVGHVVGTQLSGGWSRSDASGKFVLRSKRGAAMTISATTADGRSGELSNVPALSDQTNLVIALAADASISGKVTDEQGLPIAGAVVSGDGRIATCGSDGSYRLIGLGAGKVTVFASYRDDSIYRLDSPAPGRASIELELARGATRTGIDFRLEVRDSEIRGTVVDEDGHPVEHARVQASRRDSTVESPHADTNANGSFTMRHLARATYDLQAEDSGESARGRSSAVRAGESVTITLTKLASVSGHVTSGGAPATSFDVSCYGEHGAGDAHFHSRDGAYSIPHLAPGTYRCTFANLDGTAQRTADTSHGPARLDIALERYATLTGTLVHALTRKPIVGERAWIEGFVALVTGDGWRDREQVTDANGRFTVIHVPPGDGYLLAGRSAIPYSASAGQHLDLGEMKTVSERTGPRGQFGMGWNDDVAITEVDPSSPAERAGIRIGDTIVSIDGIAVTQLGARLARVLLSRDTLTAGETYQLGLARGLTVSVTAEPW